MHNIKSHSTIHRCYVCISDKINSDMEILKRECQNLTNLLIPTCQVELIIILGEGMVHMCMAVHIDICMYVHYYIM